MKIIIPLSIDFYNVQQGRQLPPSRAAREKVEAVTSSVSALNLTNPCILAVDRELRMPLVLAKRTLFSKSNIDVQAIRVPPFSKDSIFPILACKNFLEPAEEVLIITDPVAVSTANININEVITTFRNYDAGTVITSNVVPGVSNAVITNQNTLAETVTNQSTDNVVLGVHYWKRSIEMFECLSSVTEINTATEVPNTISYALNLFTNRNKTIGTYSI